MPTNPSYYKIILWRNGSTWLLEPQQWHKDTLAYIRNSASAYEEVTDLLPCLNNWGTILYAKVVQESDI